MQPTWTEPLAVPLRAAGFSAALMVIMCAAFMRMPVDRDVCSLLLASALSRSPCLQVDMTEIRSKVSFVCKLMLSMFGVPKAVVSFVDGHAWQQTAKGVEAIDAEPWQPFTHAVLDCEETVVVVEDAQQDGRCAQSRVACPFLCHRRLMRHNS